MKKMVITKEEVQPLVEFLEKVEVKNKLSRLRTKLIKKLIVVSVELEEERVALCVEYADKDDNGEPMIVDGVYKVKDLEALDKQINELKAEKVGIEVGEYSSNFAPLFEYLDSDLFDMPLSGVDANRYDRLLDIWEDAQEDNEEEK